MYYSTADSTGDNNEPRLKSSSIMNSADQEFFRLMQVQ